MRQHWHIVCHLEWCYAPLSRSKLVQDVAQVAISILIMYGQGTPAQLVQGIQLAWQAIILCTAQTLRWSAWTAAWPRWVRLASAWAVSASSRAKGFILEAMDCAAALLGIAGSGRAL